MPILPQASAFHHQQKLKTIKLLLQIHKIEVIL